MKRLAVLILLAATAPLGAQVVQYPLGGNLRAEQGTIELWFALAAEPDGSQKDSLHYFPFFWLRLDDEQQPRVRFNYTTIWKPDAFHLHWSSTGRTLGEFSGDPYICTIDESQTVSKADALAPGGRAPRTPRLKKDEPHYLAITWTDGLTKPKLSMILDGKVVMPPVALTAPWADDLDSMSLYLLGAPYHDNYALDELRISDTARTPEEVAVQHASGKPPAQDAHTLLLDHMDTVERKEPTEKDGKPTFTTLAEQIAGFHAERGGKMLGDNWDLVPARFGKALLITAAAREHK